MISKKLSKQKTAFAISERIKYIMAVNGFNACDTSAFIKYDEDVNDVAASFANRIMENMKNNKGKKGRKQSIATFHDMVSFHTDEKIDKTKALEIVKELYEATHKLSNREYIMAFHDDTDEPHVHIIWSNLDNDGMAYRQSNDYLVIERQLDLLEKKYGLNSPEIRKSRIYDEVESKYIDEPDSKEKQKKITTEVNELFNDTRTEKKTLSNKEKMLDVRGIESHKQQMKRDMKELLEDSYSPTEFISLLHYCGYKTIPNGNKSSYSIEKDGQTFKASELNVSYKHLKNKLKVDEEENFINAIRYRYVDPKERKEPSITVETTQKPDFMSKISKRSMLATKFRFEEFDDKIEYFYKNSNDKKSFEYHKEPSKVRFHDTTSQSIRAGLQRLAADCPPPSFIKASGPDQFCRDMWMEFHLKGYDKKGYEFKGYEPNEDDFKLLEQRKAKYDKPIKPAPENAPEAPQEAVNSIPAPTLPEQEKPSKFDYGDDFIVLNDEPNRLDEPQKSNTFDYGDDFIIVDNQPEQLEEVEDTKANYYADDFEYVEDTESSSDEETDEEVDELARLGITLDEETRQELDEINGEYEEEYEPEPEPEKPKTKVKWF